MEAARPIESSYFEGTREGVMRTHKKKSAGVNPFLVFWGLYLRTYRGRELSRQD